MVSRLSRAPPGSGRRPGAGKPADQVLLDVAEARAGVLRGGAELVLGHTELPRPARHLRPIPRVDPDIVALAGAQFLYLPACFAIGHARKRARIKLAVLESTFLQEGPCNAHSRSS